MKLSFWRRLMTDILFVAKRDKKLWIVPLIVVLVIVTVLFVLGTLAGPLAPFVYTLF